ncbi:MAG: ABC transporter ATP-binding protein, partial [Myxococcota bacterium]
MIEVTGATYRYGGDGPRVGPITLSIGAGERVWLSGASGAGKTTLLRLLSGVCARSGWGVTEGRVALDGVDPGALSPADRPGRVGFVGQDPGDQLVCGTVDDELGFGPECAGTAPAQVEAAIARERERAGLAGLGGRDPRRVSTGQQQRLVTAASLSGGARVVLLDEPLAHLDPAGADALLEHLRRSSAEGLVVVLAEHRGARVAPWATREVALSAGRVVYDGPPRVPAAPALPPRPGAVGPRRVARGGLDARYGAHVVLAGLDLELFA